jgi:hypothetical protein
VRRIIVAAAVVAVACGSLAGCRLEDGVTLPKTTLPACASSAPEPVRVESLAHQTCDLTGATLVFPDGFTVQAPPPGALSGGEECHGVATPNTSGRVRCPGRHAAGNLGSWGVVAWFTTEDGKDPTFWGTPTGIRKEREAGVK